MIIETKELSKTYNNNKVVNNININIYKGDIFGLLGRNGAGKSTTIGMLTGFVIPSSGSFTILGEDWKRLDRIKKYIGVLPDTSNYYLHLTPYEHLKFFSSLHKIKRTRKDILEILDKVGLVGHENKKVVKLSFGMKKKLGIAQALINNPELIFLDEPTSGLDPESTCEIQKLIINLSKDRKTIILTSHNLYEVEKICTRIAIMNEGRISCIGTMKELNKKYQSNIKVRINTGYVSDTQSTNFMNKIKLFSQEVLNDNNTFIIHTSDESYIPQIVRTAINEQLDIFRVDVDELNLEKIFFNLGTTE